MLIDRRNFWKLHGRWCAAAVGMALVAGVWTGLVGWSQGRWPGGGSLSGLTLGVLAAVIMLFEMALAAKKTSAFRSVRWLGSAQTWMKAHIWLGLLTVPLVLSHSGGRFGGVLTLLLMGAFLIVIASGVWGVAVQNILPRMLLEASPAETVYSQIDAVGRQYAEEARRLVDQLAGAVVSDIPLAGDRRGESGVRFAERQRMEIAGAPRRVGVQLERRPTESMESVRAAPSPAIEEALARDIEPYLIAGSIERGVLGMRERNEWYFDDLRQRVAPELRSLVTKLETLCERRRQLNVQQRLHGWLHGWVWLHLPLSVVLLLLLAGHVVLALCFG